MSNCEEIAQVAHDKLVTVRKSLSCEQFAQVAHDKRANEQIACFFERIAHSLIYHERLEKIAHGRSFVLSNLSDSLTVTHLSWAILGNRSQSLIWFEQNERMSEFPALQKTSDLLRKLMSKFPTLQWILFLLNVFDFINAYAFKINKALKWKYSEAQQLPSIVHCSLRDFYFMLNIKTF